MSKFLFIKKILEPKKCEFKFDVLYASFIQKISLFYLLILLNKRLFQLAKALINLTDKNNIKHIPKLNLVYSNTEKEWL